MYVQEALAAHDRAITLDPNNAVLVNNYGFALENLGMYKEALVVRMAPCCPLKMRLFMHLCF